MNSRSWWCLGLAWAVGLMLWGCQGQPEPRAPVREPREFVEFRQGDVSSSIRVEVIRTLPLNGATGWQVEVECAAEQGCVGVARATVEYSSDGTTRFVDLSNPLNLAFGERFVLKRVESGTMAVEIVNTVTVTVQPLPSGHHPRFKE